MDVIVRVWLCEHLFMFLLLLINDNIILTLEDVVSFRR